MAIINEPSKSQKHHDTLKRHDNTLKCHDKKAICKTKENAPSLQPKLEEEMKTNKEKKWLNIIETGPCTCTIMMYGYIGSCDDVQSRDIAEQLLDAQRRYNSIDIRINSLGGEVMEAIAIFNQLRQCKSEVNIYIDGVAASAASFIATCGRHVEMSKYARLMIHEVSGGCYGTKEEMQACEQQMASLEDTLCDIYSQKCGKTKDEIKSSYFDGKDHWMTADEAITTGLIDGIYDAEPVEEAATTEEIYNTFNNRLEAETQKRKDMNFFETLKNRKKFADCKSDEDATKIVDELERDSSEKQKLEEEKKALEVKNAKLEAEKAEREKAEKETADTEKKALLDAAEKDGRINAQTRGAYKTLLDADMECGKTALAALKPAKKAIDVVNQDDSHEIASDGAWAKKKEEIRNRYNSRVY